MTWIYELLFVLTFLQRGNVHAQLATERIQMDISENCPPRGTNTLFVRDDKSYLIQAKSGTDEPTIQHCEVIMGPYSENRSLNVTFHSFYVLNDSCGASLSISQGRSSLMEEQKLLMKLDCKTHKKPRELSFIAEKDLFLKFAVVHNLKSRKYNFRINVIAGPAKSATSSGLSIGVQIGIIVISIVAVILIGYLVYKTVRVKMSMRDMDEDDNSAALYNLNNSTQSHQNSYVPMPSQEQMEHLSRREPDPEIYFDYNPSQTHLEDKGSNDVNNGLPSPPPYEEALSMPLSNTPDHEYGVEYANINR